MDTKLLYRLKILIKNKLLILDYLLTINNFTNSKAQIKT